MPSVIRAGINENGTMTKQTAVIPVLPHIPARIGSILFHAGYGVPEGTLYCDGSAISRTTYSALFTAISTIYGAGDGSTTFNIPDLRGYFIRGAGGANSGAVGTAQGDAIRNIHGSWSAPGASNGTTVLYGASGVVAIYAQGDGSDAYNITGGTFGRQTIYIDASLILPTAAENRPMNYAMNACIIYQ